MDFHGHAIILGVIENLHKNGSWTGRTHVQKTLSLLNDRGSMQIPFEFVIYRHGPYSFDVESELAQMRSYGALEVEPNSQGYGVVLSPGPQADLARKIKPLSEEDQKAIEDACCFVGAWGVAKLEQIATTSWIRKKENVSDREGVAKRLHQLKPHIPVEEGKHADAEVCDWLGIA